ncbi:UDP-N-acetylmuramoyl-L-alanine--D-glutamate ligase [Porphyromonas crevioricanis]|uniref:UDP-N-acetylmuramoylalanine--D-glutamate ligase n=1 Tax=Porphyromonas crevioricanis TaxID=393921 RepID=A0AB34PIK6_9PORP|nr:UDP-N-acetylmuramoyl-L-alanine--D-glutamate ligase [Porphyromonas crevioricanis]KGN95378.1 UDP-N-acetylmuramoylalanine--D-glutamate ligase [Porphyromonas crevioricanis]
MNSKPEKPFDIVVLGAGESGVGAAILANKHGLSVFVSDYGQIAPRHQEELAMYGIPYEQGRHSLELICHSLEVVKSPGVAETTPVMKAVRKAGISVISEIELAARYTDAYMIGISGSNGKTTTTMWLHHALRSAGLDVGLAGNIGFSLARQVAYEPHQYYVIELSSFQLDDMYKFKANIAILLNITPDHLDRYNHRFDLYAEAKMRIIQNMGPKESFIYWADDPYVNRRVKELAPNIQLLPFSISRNEGEVSAFLNDKDELEVKKNGEAIFCIKRSELALPGAHNLQNAMAVALAASVVGISNESLYQALHVFRNVPHRLEFVRSLKDVRYVNDSKATNIQSTVAALESMTTPIVLILGGTDKGNDYSVIEEAVKEKAIGLVFLGVDNDKLHKAFDGKVAQIADARSMPEAVRKATEMARPGSTVLLSPCCASFDLFSNYEDRGDQFRACALAMS